MTSLSGHLGASTLTHSTYGFGSSADICGLQMRGGVVRVFSARLRTDALGPQRSFGGLAKQRFYVQAKLTALAGQLEPGTVSATGVFVSALTLL